MPRKPAFAYASCSGVPVEHPASVVEAHNRLAGSAITQAHPTGYPLYRLEWQSLGSLQRRLRACITGIRAQAYDFGAAELVELELYLMSRARGMSLEAPAVRP
jgi:L-cysteine S-thiosulfotransferase